MSQIGLGVLIIIIQPQRAAIKSNVHKQLKGFWFKMRYRNSARAVEAQSGGRKCAEAGQGKPMAMNWG